ncbi:MAG: glycosyltransferase family 2 protein [Bacteroidales bacterium]|nr:glycosyltransferase family 2 protein [Bacteroidales bacterium]
MQNNSTKSIAVLMTCHNRKTKTLACLDSLYKQSLSDGFYFEVFLVDDGCTDGSVDAVRKMFPDVNVIQGNGKLFWNKGMNLAWTKAIESKKHSYYLWLNDDVILNSNALEELLFGINEYEDNAIISGVTQSQLVVKATYGGYCTATGKILEPNGTFQKCDCINGNVVLISKKVYQIVGMLDPIWPHAIGDHDYSLRAQKLGIKSYITRYYIGVCENHEKPPLWCRSDIGFIEKCKNLYSPLGCSHPYYFWLYEKRHFGYFKAIKHFMSIHLRLLFPKIWEKN